MTGNPASFPRLGPDGFDRRLLAALQTDGRATLAVLAEAVRLSPSQVQRRLRALEDGGWIAGYAALLDRRALPPLVTAFVGVVLKSQAADAAGRFHLRMAQAGAVLECHKVSGEFDYLLKVYARDLAMLGRFLDEVLSADDVVASVKSQVVFETLKETQALDLELLLPASPR